MRPNGKNHSLSLDTARQLTPAVNPVEALRRQLQLAVFNSVSEEDVAKLAAKLKEQALAGDLKAMDMFLKLVMPGKEPPPPRENEGTLAAAIKDLVDESRIQRATSERRQLQLGSANGDEE